MSAAAFDTLTFSETLREAGMPEAQAKALSHALQEQFVSRLVTKSDLRTEMQGLRVELRSEMQELRAELQSDVQSVRAEVQSVRAELHSGLQSLHADSHSGLQSLRADLHSGLQSVRAHSDSGLQSLRAEIQQMELKLTIRLGGIVVVALGAFTALSKWIG